MYKTTHTIKIQHRYGHLRGVAAVLLLMLLPVCASAQTSITSLSQITDPTGNYRITDDIDASGFTGIASFSGTLEAAIDTNTKMPYRIKNLTAPLFDTLTGTVKCPHGQWFGTYLQCGYPRRRSGRHRLYGRPRGPA